MNIPKANVYVIIKHTTTGEELRLATNSEGIADFTNVPIGTYSVKLEMPDGFEFKGDALENIIIDTVSANNKVSALPYEGVDATVGIRAEAIIILRPAIGLTKNIPILTATSPITGISKNSGISGATVLSNGNDPITERGLCWSTSVNPTNINLHIAIDHLDQLTAFTGNVSGLASDTTYYVRAYALNSIGVGYGSQVSFKTAMSGSVQIPTVMTTESKTVTSTSILIGGKVTSAGDSPITQRGICWNQSPNPTVNNGMNNVPGGIGEYEYNITQLTPNTSIYIRAFAINGAGIAYGNERMIKTTVSIAIQPTVITGSSMGQTVNSLNILANSISGGSKPITERGICWSIGINPTLENGSHSAEGSGVGAFNAAITGLVASTEYHIKAYAIMDGVTTYGAEIITETLAAQPQSLPPVVLTKVATSPSNQGFTSSVTLNGSITSVGTGTITRKGFAWKAGSVPVLDQAGTFKSENGVGSDDFSNIISNLIPGLTYYYYAYAYNSESLRDFGSMLSFVAQAGLQSPAVSISNLSINGQVVTLQGAITSIGSTEIIESGFYYKLGTGNNPWVLGTKISSNQAAVGPLSGTAIDLIPGATYQFCSFATNSAGTGYSNVLTTTIAIPAGTPDVTCTIIGQPTTSSFSLNGAVINEHGSVVTERGFYYIPGDSTHDPLLGTKVVATGNNILFNAVITDLPSSTLFQVKSYAKAGTFIGYSSTLEVSTAQTVATTVPTLDNVFYETDISSIGFIMHGVILNNGGGSILDYGFEYKLGTGDPSTGGVSSTSGLGNIGSFQETLSELTPGATYTYRAWARNSIGVGKATNFITINLPAVTVQKAEVITSAVDAFSYGDATISYIVVVNANGDAVTEHGIERNGVKYPSGSGSGSKTKWIQGLSPTTNYQVRAYAINSAGTSYGQYISFMTSYIPNVAPSVETSNPASITPTTVNLVGVITSDGAGSSGGGHTISDHGFYYKEGVTGTAAEIVQGGNLVSKGAYAGVLDDAYTSSVTGLVAGTYYMYVAYATNEVGTSYGAPIVFTTAAAEATVSVTTVLSNTGTTGVTVTGVIAGTPVGTIVSRNVCISTSPNPTLMNSLQSVDVSNTFTVTVTGLLPNTLYYVRTLLVMDPLAAIYGPETSFTTINAPIVTTKAVTNITPTGVTVGGILVSDGGVNRSTEATAHGVAINATNAPSQTNTTSSVGFSDNWDSTVSPLAEGVWYARAWAEWSKDGITHVVYGDAVEFTISATSGFPIGTTTEIASSITSTSATTGGYIAFEGGSAIIQKGMCYSTSPSPSLSDSVTSEGSGPTSWSGIISDLSSNTLYYYRAYATNGFGTTYGSVLSFTTST